MPSIVRAGIEFGHAEEAGRRTLAPDEDEFTLAAAAIERALGSSAKLPASISVHLVGSFRPSVEGGLAGLLGRPVTVAHHAAGGAGTLEAFAHTLREPARAHLLITADVPSPGAESSPGAVATALWISDGPGIDYGAGDRETRAGASFAGWPGVGLPPSGRSIGALHAALGPDSPGDDTVLSEGEAPLRFHRSASIEWVGPWLGPREPARPVTPAAGAFASPATLASVSQGAYVPWARYVENLASRWRFEGERCTVCQRTSFPPTGACPNCGTNGRLERVELPRQGLEVLAVTRIAPGAQPTEFDGFVEATGGYSVVLVELAPGARVTLMVADAESAHIGERVGSGLRRLYPMEGEWRYGRKAYRVRA